MSKEILLLSYNNPVSSQHVRELIENLKNDIYPIHTTVNSHLIIRECLALGITPIIVPNINEISCADAEIYIFYKGNSQTLTDYKATVEALGGECNIIKKF